MNDKAPVPARSNSRKFWTQQRKNGYQNAVNEREYEDALLAQWWKAKERPKATRKGAKGYK